TAAKALIGGGAMTREGGGQGVSDILELFTFSSPSGGVIGFQALFESDDENGLDHNGMNGSPLISCPWAPMPSADCIAETGSLVSMFSGTVTLPGTPGLVTLTVNAQSDLEAVPEPSAFVLVGTVVLVYIIMRRRCSRSVA